MASTGTKDLPETAEEGEANAAVTSARSVDRRGLAVAIALLAACTGLVLYAVLNAESPATEQPVPTAAVTYEVSGDGTVDLAYQGHSVEGAAEVVRRAVLPWKKTVRVPLGKPPTLTVTLGGEGGEARCRLAVRGKHVQTATAFGTYGRATCQGGLPAPEDAAEGAAR